MFCDLLISIFRIVHLNPRCRIEIRTEVSAEHLGQANSTPSYSGGSDLGLKIGNSELGILWILSFPPGKWRDGTTK
jgi:hypothetical protein